jgi:hypothetical protein
MFRKLILLPVLVLQLAPVLQPEFAQPVFVIAVY